MLKKEKMHYEERVEELKGRYEEMEGGFERKYKELEEFEKFFEEFKKEREVVSGLQDEIEDLNLDIANKKGVHSRLESEIADLELHERQQSERLAELDRKCFEKSEELRLYEEKVRGLDETLARHAQ